MMRQRNVDQKAEVLMSGSDHHLKNCNNDVGETISKNIYVDNVISGPRSCQEAVHFYNVSKQVFKGAAMNLQDWMTNSQEVLNEIPTHDRANRGNIKMLGLRIFLPTLGLSWFAKEDGLLSY